MSISVEDVRYIAGLARLRFAEEEEQRLAREMGAILDYVDQLNELDTTGVPPMAHVLDLYNVYRSDKASPRISREEALRNAPDADGEYFRVPKVIA
jgi:aspartyl-tRNA(Asn)/glutamyl-tRNA(Gln) amidotransferase subunit C